MLASIRKTGSYSTETAAPVDMGRQRLAQQALGGHRAEERQPAAAD